MRLFLLTVPLLALVASATHDRPVKRHGHGKRASGGVKRQSPEVNNVSFANATTHDLAKRQTFTGRGTYYYTGLGACGQYSKDSDNMVALNSAQYGGGYPGPQCFKYITIQANGVTVSDIQIMDECPTCGWGDLDLSPGLFSAFANQGAGVIQMTWWFQGSNPQPQPSTTTTTTQAPTTTWQPAPTTTWQAPTTTTQAQTTTWQPSTTTTQASTSASTTTTSSSSQSTSMSASSSNSTRISASATNTTNPFAVVSSVNATMTSVSASASASAGISSVAGTGNSDLTSASNFVMLNGVVTNYGQIIVSGAGGNIAGKR